MKVYLAGGMKSGWQKKVKKCLPEHIYFDPSKHGLTNPKEYTKWDLDHVRKSDIIFAYFEKTNPSGFGMSVEIGFAKALSIPIIFVDEKNLKSWDMVRECCDIVFDNLDKGIQNLKSRKRL